MHGPKPEEEWTYFERRDALDMMAQSVYAGPSSVEWAPWGDPEGRVVWRWTVESFLDVGAREWPGEAGIGRGHELCNFGGV